MDLYKAFLRDYVANRLIEKLDSDGNKIFRRAVNSTKVVEDTWKHAVIGADEKVMERERAREPRLAWKWKLHYISPHATA